MSTANQSNIFLHPLAIQKAEDFHTQPCHQSVMRLLRFTLASKNPAPSAPLCDQRPQSLRCPASHTHPHTAQIWFIVGATEEKSGHRIIQYQVTPVPFRSIGVKLKLRIGSFELTHWGLNCFLKCPTDRAPPLIGSRNPRDAGQ